MSDYYVGQKLGEIWGYVTDGFFTSENIALASQQSLIKSSNGGNTMIGDIKFLDLNKDGVINTGANTVDNPGDRKIIGNEQPRYTFGALFDFDWNNFLSVRFSRVLQSRIGGLVRKQMHFGDRITGLIIVCLPRW